jgi:hypothetical protein
LCRRVTSPVTSPLKKVNEAGVGALKEKRNKYERSTPSICIENEGD